MVVNIDIPGIVRDALVWETIKFLFKFAIGAVIMTAAGRLLLKAFDVIKERRQEIAYWIATPIFLFVFLLLLAGSNSKAAPELSGNIAAAYFNHAAVPSDPDNVVLLVGVVNSGLMPSIAGNWQVRIIQGEKPTPCLVAQMPSQVGITIPAHDGLPSRRITLSGNDALPIKTLTPIPLGGAVAGVLFCVLKNVSLTGLRPGDEIEMSFLDVLSNTHTASMILSSDRSDVKYFPGISEDVR